MMRRIIWAALLGYALLSGCDGGGGGGPSDGGADASLYGPIVRDSTCSASSPLIGDAEGGFAVDSFPVTWHYSDAEDVSWAPAVHLSLRPDVTSIGIFVDHGVTKTAIGYLSLAGRTWVDMDAPAGDPTSWAAGPFRHQPSMLGGLVMPMGEASRPTAGCLVVLPLADDLDRVGQRGTLHVVTRGGAPVDNLVDLNLFTVPGAGIDPAEIDDAVAATARLLEANDLATIGVTRHYDATGPAELRSRGPEINTLREQASAPGADPRAIDLFFVSDFSDAARIVAVSSGVPGPIGLHGTPASGVVLSVTSHVRPGPALDTAWLGETIAHELGHFVGLGHTTEARGDAHDALGDTPECDATHDADDDGFVDADECAADGGDNLMFWGGSDAMDQHALSPSQRRVFAASPAIR